GPGHERREVPNASGSAILNVAKSRIGKQYMSGGTGPDLFDCSGLVLYSHNQCGVYGVPRVAKDQARGGKAGSGAAGDVVYFGNPAHHVGICCGDGSMVHAPRPGKTVCILKIAYMKESYGYRRYY
uniref:Clan CA, family C40, NlpC/P60 superfamily cysteine peptidase n=1 Tax=Trichomonas vaginalis (strain ATCC PRA-98 / G3) TaxID=412133 RepID=UPI00280071F0|nr:Chain A, Clan CA, family C40, NlpC/P60 superfamily cysteine peptidase [Trichomonas vaginalis G3]8EV5_A Chain A, Clan CA, family C40, NlpC/P60 superfamily cysteine peptidase [Trichomonas vaginalis]